MKVGLPLPGDVGGVEGGTLQLVDALLPLQITDRLGCGLRELMREEGERSSVVAGLSG